jgi:8-amino-7-oxononanoate synthase
MSRLISELDVALEERAAKGLRRERRIVDSAQGAHLRVDGRDVLHFGSNDYLGLAGDARVVAAAQAGAARYGVGAGASHLISGHFAPHDAIERDLAAWIAPCANARGLLFSTGYLANLAIVTALVGRGDMVFADKLNHACLNDAALLSRADFVRYAHGDLEALEKRLASSAARRKLIATDAVFSMDGDIADLASLLALAEKYDAWLAVDDAHGFGVLGDRLTAGAGNSGRGTLAQLGLASERVVYMATLGKAAGVAGAFVAAHDSIIETLIQTARAYIFTTASPPMLSCALAASIALIRDEPARRMHLFALIEHWRNVAPALPWETLPSATAIQPLILGTNNEALRVSDELWRRNIWVPAIRPPTVPQGSARLRITFSASHSFDDVDILTDALADVAR